jgi:NAD(P)-dependent dehydrogenase (short-subunit alcohol dehydrogenase family)
VTRPLEGRVAIVTGGLGLLGRRHARALHEAGAYVVIADLDGVACRQAAWALGDRAIGAAVDVTDPGSLAEARDHVLRRFDRLDVLVCDAAIDDKVAPSDDPDASRPERLTADRFRRLLDVNVTGTFLACQAFGAAMVARKRGSIVTIASTYGLVAPDPSLYVRPDGTRAFWKSVAYPASKGAVLAMTRALAAAWGASGVRVNAISPGGVENGQAGWFVERYGARTPLGRMASVEDLDGALLYLAGDASAYVTGANLVVDGGFTSW